MQELHAYYDRLKTFIKDRTLFDTLSENNIKKHLKIDPEIIPFLSYTLASYPDVHTRIDQIYDAYGASGPDLESQYDHTDVAGLAETLSPQTRIRYRKLVMICLNENDQTRRQLLKLLKRICPDSYLEDKGEIQNISNLLAGAFDARHLTITYLSLYLQRTTLFMDADFARMIWDLLTNSLLLCIPLPGFEKLPKDCVSSDQADINLILDHVLTEVDLIYNEQYSMIENMLHKDNARKNKAANLTLAPLNAMQTFSSPGSFLNSMSSLPAPFVDAFKEACKHPASKHRRKIMGDKGVRKRIKENEEKQKTEGQRTEEQCKHDFYTLFHQLLHNLDIGYEEICNTTIYPEDLTIINAACDDRADFRNENENDQSSREDNWKRLSIGELLAAFLICALVRRTKNAENALDQLMTALPDQMQEANKCNEIPVAPDHPQKPEDPDLTPLTDLRQKNKILVSQINTEKEKRKTQEAQWKRENEELKRENEQLKETIQQLLSTQEPTSDAKEEDIRRDEMEQMKKVIVEAGTLFVSGHPSWQTAMKVEFPQSRFVEAREYAIAPSVFRNIHFIVYHLQNGNHSMYNKCLELKNKDTKLFFINQNNTGRCVKQIYDYIMENNRKKANSES